MTPNSTPVIATSLPVTSQRRLIATRALLALASLLSCLALIGLIGGRLERHLWQPMTGATAERLVGLASACWCAWALLRRRHTWSTIALPLCLGVLAFYLIDGRELFSTDNLPANRIAAMVLRSGSVTFDGDWEVQQAGDHLPYWFVRSRGHVYSRYPIASGLLALPVFVPSIVGGGSASVFPHLGKVGAAILTAIGVALLFLAMRTLISARAAAAAALVYATCTAAFPLLSQSIWQHTGSALALAFGLYALFALEGRRRAACVAVAAALMVLCRPVDALLGMGLVGALLVLDTRWETALIAAFVGAAAVSPMAFYNWVDFGAPWHTGYGAEASEGWTTPFAQGFSGLLFSPARGILLYCPFLIFAGIGLAEPSLASRQTWAVRVLGISAAGFILLMSKWWAWSGAWCAGPRMLSETLPIWMLGFGLIFERMLTTKLRRVALVASIAVAAMCHLLLVFGPSAPAYQDLIIHPEPWNVRAYPPLALWTTLR